MMGLSQRFIHNFSKFRTIFSKFKFYGLSNEPTRELKKVHTKKAKEIHKSTKIIITSFKLVKNSQSLL